MIVNSFSFPSKVHRPSAFHNQFQLKTTLRELALSEEGDFEGKGGRGIKAQMLCKQSSKGSEKDDQSKSRKHFRGDHTT